ncbi:MAG: hypothetical protein MHPSP_003054, partial [Paramarteilia canceri]
VSLALLLLKVNSFEDNRIFEQLSSTLYIDQDLDDTLIFKWSHCPKGSTKIEIGGEYKCQICENGTTSNSVNSTDCNDCLPTYEKIADDSGNGFYCNECEIDKIARPSNSNEYKKLCSETICHSTKYYSFFLYMCTKCSETLSNSIGRPDETPPLEEYCSCSNDSIKIEINNNEKKCHPNNIHDDKLYEDLSKISLENKVFGLNYFLNSDQMTRLSLLNCHPYDRPIIDEYNCACNKGFLLHNGRCQGCTNLIKYIDNLVECYCPIGTTLIDSQCEKCLDGQYKNTVGFENCKKCPPNTVSTENRSDCLCVEGFGLKDNQCVACSEGQYKNHIGNESCSPLQNDMDESLKNDPEYENEEEEEVSENEEEEEGNEKEEEEDLKIRTSVKIAIIISVLVGFGLIIGLAFLLITKSRNRRNNSAEDRNNLYRSNISLHETLKNN